MAVLGFRGYWADKLKLERALMMPKIDFFVCALTVTFDAVIFTELSVLHGG
jgi:hypothetical protein